MQKRILQALPLGITLYLLCVGLALATPPLPFSPYGTAKINGANVADGTVIGAWCGGVQYDSATTQLYAGESWYGLSIRGDDPDTAGVKEGCAAGETVRFKIGSLWAGETAVWTSGAGPQLNLTANTATATPTPTATRTRTPSATPSAPPAATITPTRTPAATPTATRTATSASTPTPSATPNPTSTATVTPTRTPAATPTATRTDTSTPTPSITPNPTSTATVTPTRTPSHTPSITPTVTWTLTPTAGPDDIALTGVIYDRAAGYAFKLSGARIVALLCISPTVESYAGPDGRYELIIRATQAQNCPDVSLIIIAIGYQSFIGAFSVADLHSQPQRDFGLLPVWTATSPARLIYVPLILRH